MPGAVVTVVGNRASLPQLIALAKTGLSVCVQVLLVAGRVAELKWIREQVLVCYLFFISELSDIAVMHC